MQAATCWAFGKPGVKRVLGAYSFPFISGVALRALKSPWAYKIRDSKGAVPQPTKLACKRGPFALFFLSPRATSEDDNKM